MTPTATPPRRWAACLAAILAVAINTMPRSLHGAPGPEQPATASADARAVERTVRDFNGALSARNLDGALALLAPGAVHFDLQPAHGFSSAPGTPAPLTTDLATHWRTVAPILFSAAQAFKRETAGVTVRVEGDLAMAWTDVRTVTEPRGGGAAVRVQYSEVHLLRRTAPGWRIIASASSRPTR